MTPTGKTFLVVDDNADSRFLLVKTMLRKFPTAVIHECQESGDAVRIAQSEPLAAIIAHRAADLDGISLIRELRAASPDVIILMVSGLDRTDKAIRAGATCFLNYDEWLLVGSLVTDLLSRQQAVRTDFAAERASPNMRGPEADTRDGIRPITKPAAPKSSAEQE
jgi:CheY-like chemotaxis protein